MSLLLPRHSPAFSHEGPGGLLPASEPPCLAPPHWSSAVIFTMVVGMVTWLLARGYSPQTALGIVTGTGLAAASITSWLADAQPADGRPAS
jgi:hypothetical protein